MLILIKHIFILTCIATLVSSCATLNKDECKTANWRTIGYEDGTRGYKSSRIGQHRSACAEYGIHPDLNAYNAGRDEGLHHYCIPVTAYNKGLSGYSYNGVCAGYNENVFLDAFDYGFKIYKKSKRLQKLKNKYTEEKKYITHLEIKLHKKEDRLVSGKLSKVKALQLLNQTKEIAEELGRAKSNLDHLDNKIHKLSHRIKYLKDQSGYN